MWVDVICIDQSNDIEKGPQVALMGKIYRHSTRVIAWLGQEKDDSTRALNTMSWVGVQIDADYSRWIIEPSENCMHPSFRDMDADIPLRPEDTRAIFHLLSREWFERLWIRQEILASEPKSVIQCGYYCAAWTLFRRALLCLYMKRRPWSIYEGKLYDRLISLRGLIGQPPTVGLGFIRVVFGQSDCADPHDRVYAVLGFLPEADRAVVGTPDYTQDVAVIFGDILRRWVMRFGSLDLLSQSEPGANELLSSPLPPSWIPDWSKKEVIFGRNYWRGFASSHFAAAASFSGNCRTLTTPGIKLVEIRHLQAIPIMRDRHVKEVEDALRQLLSHSNALKGAYVTGSSMLEAYARTFLANALAENEEPWRGEDPTLQEAMDIVSQLNEASNVSGPQHPRALGPSDAFFKIARAMVGGRQLMFDSDGYIGIVPRLARRGDIIYMVLGCHSPMVLRPVAAADNINSIGSGVVRVVGECYVLGLSEGEGLLGPLPENIRRKFGSNSDLGVYSYFEDVRTGHRFFEDPRLPSSLPPADLAEFRARLRVNPNAKLHLAPESLAKVFPRMQIFNIV
ncbi:heterokaryon incompatibility protein-domain-containing protein [Aspergillus desertorum]